MTPDHDPKSLRARPEGPKLGAVVPDGRNAMNRAAPKTDIPPKVDLTRLTRSSRSPGPIVRDLSGVRDEKETGMPLWLAFGTGRAWLVATLFKALAVLLIAGAFLLGPPVLECHQRAETGFFTGETLLGCIGEATNHRVQSLENWINTLVRRSGT